MCRCSSRSNTCAATHRPSAPPAWRWICRPGGAPFDRLAGALAAAGQPTNGAQLRDPPDGLAVAVRQLARARGARILVFIDQFEELFTLAAGDAVAFCEAAAA